MKFGVLPRERHVRSVSAAVEFDAVVEAVPTKRALEFAGVVDEKDRVDDVALFGEPGEKSSGDRDRIRGKQPDVEELARRWIDRGVEPVLLVVDANHLLIDRITESLNEREDET